MGGDPDERLRRDDRRRGDEVAGNILRNFAQACAIIVGGFGSWALFGFVITANFVGGVDLVILSIFIYGSKPEQLAQWRDAALDKLGGALGRKPASYSQVPTRRPPPTRVAARRQEAGALGRRPTPAAESADARRREGGLNSSARGGALLRGRDFPSSLLMLISAR